MCVTTSPKDEDNLIQKNKMTSIPPQKREKPKNEDNLTPKLETTWLENIDYVIFESP